METPNTTVFLNFYENIFSLILNFFVKTQKCDSHFLLKVILTKLKNIYIYSLTEYCFKSQIFYSHIYL